MTERAIGPSREFLLRAGDAEDEYGTPAIGHHHFASDVVPLWQHVRDIEARCELAERKVAEARATLVVNLRPGRLDGLTAREAVEGLLLVLFSETPDGEVG